MVRSEEAARWLAEAVTSGNPLAPLPTELTPKDLDEGEATAAALLDALGTVACGLRIAPGPDGVPLAGPLIDSRLLPNDTPLPRSMLRHPRATAAILAVLGADLAPDDDAPPVLAALHPALDIADSRFTTPPALPPVAAADLGGLGHVVAGRGRTPVVRSVLASLAVGDGRPRGLPVDPMAALAPAVAAARRLGGLPAGAILLAAGLSPPRVPGAGEVLVARLGTLGTARVRFG